MEQNEQVVAKKLWHIVRVVFVMLRKNMSKRKLLLDLKYLTMKRPKLAGKPFTGKPLTGNHHNGGGEYEFSCSNTPNHPNYIFPFEFNHKKETQNYHEIYTINKVVERMLDSCNFENDDVEGSPFPYFYSPLELRVGQSPIVRVTDSPYPLHEIGNGNGNGNGNNYKVDEAAEVFIQRFYDQLRQQRIRDV